MYANNKEICKDTSIRWYSQTSMNKPNKVMLQFFASNRTNDVNYYQKLNVPGKRVHCSRKIDENFKHYHFRLLTFCCYTFYTSIHIPQFLCPINILAGLCLFNSAGKYIDANTSYIWEQKIVQIVATKIFVNNITCTDTLLNQVISFKTKKDRSSSYIYLWCSRQNLVGSTWIGFWFDARNFAAVCKCVLSCLKDWLRLKDWLQSIKKPKLHGEILVYCFNW